MLYLLDLMGSCSDYNFISILVVLKRILAIFQLVVPIILVVSCMWGLIRLMINPDDKKGFIGLKNKVMAALVCIFVPFVVNLVLMWTEESFNVSLCWSMAEEYKAQLDATDQYDVATSTGEKKFVQKDLSDYHFSDKKAKGSALGKDIVQYALTFVGKKYAWGGGHNANESLEDIFARGGGVDCSGFTSGVYRHFGYDITGTDLTQANMGREVAYNEAQAGDLIVYHGHVAIFMGDGNKIVHASSPRSGIKITDNATYRAIKTVRRII